MGGIFPLPKRIGRRGLQGLDHTFGGLDDDAAISGNGSSRRNRGDDAHTVANFALGGQEYVMTGQRNVWIKTIAALVAVATLAPSASAFFPPITPPVIIPPTIPD